MNKHENCECAACRLGIDAVTEMIHTAIDNRGYAVICTPASEGGSYAYTVGRSLVDKSEYLIGYGYTNVVHAVEAFIEDLDETENVSVQWLSADEAKCNVPVILLDLLNEVVDEHCPMIESITGRKPSEVRCRLVVFPDANGLWPWDEGADQTQFWPRHAEDPAITIDLLETAGLYHNGVTGPVVRH